MPAVRIQSSLRSIGTKPEKGNQSILELLEREAAAAGQERLRRAKVRGEEASTKLLLPMIMQLVVVLIILMVPAFMSFFKNQPTQTEIEKELFSGNHLVILHRKSGRTSKGGRAMNVLKEFWKEEDAVGVVEIILILVAIFTHDKSVYKTCI